MLYTIIDGVKIGGIQFFDRFDKLNPVEVRITISEVSTFLSRFTRNKYRFIVNNLLFSSSLKKDTNVIFVCCNGLNEAKEVLKNRKFEKTLGIVNISQIDTWEKVKGKKKWVNVPFNKSELDPTLSEHFAFGFVHNILNAQIY